jgi:hypothetical protein
MTAPGSGRDDATIRGAVVLVVAIVIGLALLARSGGGGDDDGDDRADQTTESTASTEATDGSDTTVVPVQDNSTTESTAPTGSTQDPATITVVVLNATDTTGWAGENAGILQSAGYVTDQGNPASGENSDTTTIYATPEAQADAQAVAAVLNLADAPVTQKPAEPLGDAGQDAEADVVVVLGADSVTG